MEKTISPESFAMVCFLVMMQNGAGLNEKSPDYITEKMTMLRSGLNSFAYLDIQNMRKVIHWCKTWGVGVPKEVAEEMERQNCAEQELVASGFLDHLEY